jgi:hypothetical protein
MDANLYHDLVTGRSVTGLLHFLNKTPIDWFSKLQTTVATATYGSESTAARTCIDQVVDMRTTLRHMGVEVYGPAYVFGDNLSVIMNGSIPHSTLQKRWHMLAHHRVREAVAAGFVNLFHVEGKKNPADILSKHWDLPSVWDVLKPLLFWSGDTADIPKHKGMKMADVKKMEGQGKDKDGEECNKA